MKIINKNYCLLLFTTLLFCLFFGEQNSYGGCDACQGALPSCLNNKVSNECGEILKSCIERYLQTEQTSEQIQGWVEQNQANLTDAELRRSSSVIYTFEKRKLARESSIFKSFKKRPASPSSDLLVKNCLREASVSFPELFCDWTKSAVETVEKNLNELNEDLAVSASPSDASCDLKQPQSMDKAGWTVKNLQSFPEDQELRVNVEQTKEQIQKKEDEIVKEVSLNPAVADDPEKFDQALQDALKDDQELIRLNTLLQGFGQDYVDKIHIQALMRTRQKMPPRPHHVELLVASRNITPDGLKNIALGGSTKPLHAKAKSTSEEGNYWLRGMVPADQYWSDKACPHQLKKFLEEVNTEFRNNKEYSPEFAACSQIKDPKSAGPCFDGGLKKAFSEMLGKKKAQEKAELEKMWKGYLELRKYSEHSQGDILRKYYLPASVPVPVKKRFNNKVYRLVEPVYVDGVPSHSSLYSTRGRPFLIEEELYQQNKEKYHSVNDLADPTTIPGVTPQILESWRSKFRKKMKRNKINPGPSLTKGREAVESFLKFIQPKIASTILDTVQLHDQSASLGPDSDMWIFSQNSAYMDQNWTKILTDEPIIEERGQVNQLELDFIQNSGEVARKAGLNSIHQHGVEMRNLLFHQNFNDFPLRFYSSDGHMYIIEEYKDNPCLKYFNLIKFFNLMALRGHHMVINPSFLLEQFAKGCGAQWNCLMLPRYLKQKIYQSFFTRFFQHNLTWSGYDLSKLRERFQIPRKNYSSIMKNITRILKIDLNNKYKMRFKQK